MLYIKIYRKQTWRDAYMIVTYTVEHEQNLLFYKINFADDKIRLLAKHTSGKNIGLQPEDINLFGDQLRNHQLYKSIVLNIPGINLSYLNLYRVFNLI